MNVPPCTVCDAPGEVVVTLTADERCGSIASCRAHVATVLLDMAEGVEIILGVVREHG